MHDGWMFLFLASQNVGECSMELELGQDARFFSGFVSSLCPLVQLQIDTEGRALIFLLDSGLFTKLSTLPTPEATSVCSLSDSAASFREGFQNKSCSIMQHHEGQTDSPRHSPPQLGIQTQMCSAS